MTHPASYFTHLIPTAQRSFFAAPTPVAYLSVFDCLPTCRWPPTDGAKTHLPLAPGRLEDGGVGLPLSVGFRVSLTHWVRAKAHTD